MVDLTAAAAALTSLKSAYELAKAMGGIRDAVKFQEKAFELQREILAAQQNALNAQAEQSSLLDSIRLLEKQNSDARSWEKDRKRYELKTFGVGVFVYRLKPQKKNAEPIHLLCTNCFTKNRKSILQDLGGSGGGRRVRRCPSCMTTFTLPTDVLSVAG